MDSMEISINKSDISLNILKNKMRHYLQQQNTVGQPTEIIWFTVRQNRTKIINLTGKISAVFKQ